MTYFRCGPLFIERSAAKLEYCEDKNKGCDDGANQAEEQIDVPVDVLLVMKCIMM